MLLFMEMRKQDNFKKFIQESGNCKKITVDNGSEFISNIEMVYVDAKPDTTKSASRNKGMFQKGSDSWSSGIYTIESVEITNFEEPHTVQRHSVKEN